MVDTLRPISNYFIDNTYVKKNINYDVPIIKNIDSNLKYIYEQFINPKKRTIVSKAIKLNKKIIIIEIENKLKKRIITEKDEKLRSKILKDKSLISDIVPDEGIIEKYKHYLEHEEFNIEPLYSNNRIGFLNEIKRRMSQVQPMITDTASCKSNDSEKSFNRLIHQEIVVRYINSYTPYRGILLYHGLGSGKTCSSISLIEGMMTSNKIYIITPASLQANYRTQIKFCGEQLFRTDHYWVFEPINYINDVDNKKAAFCKLTGINKVSLELNKFIKNNKGLWFIKEDKSSNYKKLTIIQQEQINEQIEIMIRAKYNFINYNGLTRKSWETNYKKANINPFDNTTVIIDEVHNFINSVLNKLNVNRTSVSTEVYRTIMDAENCRVVVLSGTPYINYPSELGCLFNLIHGYTKAIKIKINSLKTVLTQDYFDKIFKPTEEDPKGLVDIIEYNTNKSEVRFIKNNYGFIKEPSGKMKYDEKGEMYLSDFTEYVVKKLKEHSEDLKIVSIENERILNMPEKTKEFDSYFVTSTNEIKNKGFFQRRIIGLVSYLGDKRELMPDIIISIKDGKESDIHLEYIDMSSHQVEKYEEVRKTERTQESNKRKKKEEEEKKSSYRVFSRSACNFSFPTEMPRPFPKFKGKKITDKELTEEDIDAVTIQELNNDERFNVDDIKEEKIDTDINEYALEINKVLDEFYKNANKYFETNIEKYVKVSSVNLDDNSKPLDTYSPKFVSILKNIINSDNIGCKLLYTNFRKLEGIGLLRIALLYHGYKEIKIIKNANGDFSVKLNGMYNDTDYINTKVFALYTGTETAEEKEIIRNIYNNEHNKLPNTVQKELIKIYPGLTDGNLYGDMIDLLMITASGAEGIDLKNVRFVHIMEPYWHHVRINQVIGRARRICSHASLPEDLQTVKVYMYISILPKEVDKEKYNDLINKDNGKTTDENLYDVMERKHKLSQMFLDTLKETSIDCIVNHANDKGKCYHIPTQNDDKNKNKLITPIEYDKAPLTENPKETTEKTKHKIIVKSFVIEGVKIPFAVDEKNGYVYDLFQFKKNPENKIKLGVIKDGQLILDK